VNLTELQSEHHASTILVPSRNQLPHNIHLRPAASREILGTSAPYSTHHLVPSRSRFSMRLPVLSLSDISAQTATDCTFVAVQPQSTMMSFITFRGYLTLHDSETLFIATTPVPVGPRNYGELSSCRRTLDNCDSVAESFLRPGMRHCRRIAAYVFYLPVSVLETLVSVFFLTQRPFAANDSDGINLV
jgi:hypothetical protein